MALYEKDFQITCNYIEIVKCPVKSVADHRSKNKPPSPLHYTVGPNVKKPAKNKIQKSVKLTDHTCSCSYLIDFEYESHAIPGSGKRNKPSEIMFKKTLEITSSELIFGGFRPFGTTVRERAEQKLI